jgi:hypothetical protein
MEHAVGVCVMLKRISYAVSTNRIWASVLSDASVRSQRLCPLNRTDKHYYYSNYIKPPQLILAVLSFLHVWPLLHLNVQYFLVKHCVSADCLCCSYA